jgi:hypothetical protein
MIVSDGPERLRHATKEQRARRKQEIRSELSRLAESEFKMAGFFRRLSMLCRLRMELRRRLNSEFPSSRCLHLLPRQ